MPWLEIVGWAGSALIIVSLTQARVLRFRVLNLVGALLAVAYNTWLSIWPFTAMNAVIAVIDMYWLRRLLAERHDGATYQVVEVAPSDEYLRHVIRVHIGDIRTFQPGFVWDPHAPGRSAYLVQRGDETVGVVVVADEGNGVGQVELDFVTPRFRDFTPGEFVYQRSSVLADRGLRRLVAPPDLVHPESYYPRVGFHLDGAGSWVRDVA
jgi:hypothetical protein